MSLIYRPRYLPYIGIYTLNVMAFSFRPDYYHVSNHSSTILKRTNSPSWGHIQSKTLARPREGLWVYISCDMMKKKAAVREWCRRRVRATLEEELQKRGFDKDGQYAGDGTGWGEEKKKSGLAGTLELIGTERLLVMKRSEVCRQAGLIVERVEEMCRDPEKSKWEPRIMDLNDKEAWKRP